MPVERDLDRRIYDKIELFVQRFHSTSNTLKDEDNS